MTLSQKTIGLLSAVGLGVLLMSADHIDAPAVTGTSADITDYYAFQNSAEDAIVFVANTQGLLAPAETGNASFEEDVLVEFNIDQDADNVEDLVIQAIIRDGEMYVFGPMAPNETGVASTINADASTQVKVAVTPYGSGPVIGRSDGLVAFAGPRDDPFFFDLGAYQSILSGTAPGFADPGTDTFAGTNVLSIVVEVPKSLLGDTGSINTWVTTSTRS